MSERAVVVSLDVGGTLMKGAVTARDGAQLFRLDQPTNTQRGPQAVLAGIDATIGALFAAVPHDREPVAIGLIVPGLVDPRRGIALYSVNMGWRDVPLAERIRERFGLPVGLDHDVRAAGLAEVTLGRARGFAHALYLSLGTGVAAALIVDGRLISGSRGMSGEIGHVAVYPDGEPCGCGQRGCLESYAGAAAITRRYATRTGLAGVTAEQVQVRAGAGDGAAQQVWADAVTGLSRALAGCVLLLDPEVIVIGGGLARAGDALFPSLRRQVQDALAWRPAPPIEAAHFMSDAGRVGAALVGWSAAEAAP